MGAKRGAAAAVTVPLQSYVPGIDGLTTLGSGGVIWLLTPKSGRTGHVEPSDIGEAAPTAGLSATSSVAAAPDWSGTRLVTPKSSRR